MITSHLVRIEADGDGKYFATACGKNLGRLLRYTRTRLSVPPAPQSRRCGSCKRIKDGRRTSGAYWQDAD